MNDFWRMVWQQNVTQIVMLTNQLDGGKVRKFIYLILLYTTNEENGDRDAYSMRLAKLKLVIVVIQ